MMSHANQLRERALVRRRYATRAIRQIVYRGTLGLNIGSAVRNLTQGANTYAKLGGKYTLVGYTKLALKLASNNLDEVYDGGVLNDNLIQSARSASTKKASRNSTKGSSRCSILRKK
jgi:hypothetical protein